MKAGDKVRCIHAGDLGGGGAPDWKKLDIGKTYTVTAVGEADEPYVELEEVRGARFKSRRFEPIAVAPTVEGYGPARSTIACCRTNALSYACACPEPAYLAEVKPDPYAAHRAALSRNGVEK